ncbi:MAG: cyclic-di-AMP receptor [Anaerolineales bacterium]|nr:cyclic-di-AMP receptor [Anaerolineales bacterium]
MKMIVAIVEASQAERISQALLAADFRVTQLASTGGFLREGATTLMIGVPAVQVEAALQVIRDQHPGDYDPERVRATLYVLNVKDFNRV